MKNWTANSPKRAYAAQRGNRSASRTATPSRVWVAVSSTSSTCRASSTSEVEPPPNRWATGRLPISSVHWLTLALISIPSASAALPRKANSSATMNSGASDASGASHCTSRNWSSPSASPLPISASANGSAQARMTSAEPANIATTSGRRCAAGSAPIRAAGPTRSCSPPPSSRATRTR